MHDVNDTEAHEPLIRSSSENNLAEISEADDTPTPLPQEYVSNSKALWLLTLSASLSGLLFGYDTGIISSTLLTLSTSLSRPLTTWDKSLITSSTSLLALLCSPLAGYFADKLGRRPVIAIASLLFVAGALIQAVAGRVWFMVVGRAVVGAAVGLASSVSPLYIAEIAPKDMRGKLVTVQSLFITGGQVVAYLVGWAVQGRWRWAVGLGAVPAIVQAALLVGLDESPRWLVMKGKDTEAVRVLRRLGEESGDAERLVKSIQKEVEEESAILGKEGLGRSLKELLTVPGNRRALIIACMLQGLQQLCGFNSLMYFSATIFSLVGFTSPITTSLSIALTNFALTLLAFAIIDRVGRRRILLLSIPFMILGLGACSLAFSHIDPNNAGHELAPAMINSTIWPNVLLASLILYVAAYAVGLGCVPWQQSELFPLSVRSLGSGLATTTNWTTNCITAVSFLPMMQGIGASATFACYALVCTIGWGLVFGIYPETAGLALEEVGALLKEGWCVWGREKSTQPRRRDRHEMDEDDQG